MTTSLNVILHGELAFHDVVNADYIDVYAPEMDAHAYMAGPWLGEQRIPAGSALTLTPWVKGGMASFAKDDVPSTFLVIEGVKPFPAGHHFAIRLPRPEKIVPLDVRKVDQGSVQPGTATVSSQPSGNYWPMARGCIFQYSVDSKDLPALIPVVSDAETAVTYNWIAQASRDGASYSLHVWAQNDGTITSEVHPEEAFRMTLQLLGVNGSITAKENDCPLDPQPDFPEGVWPAEMKCSLSSRILLLRGCVQGYASMQDSFGQVFDPKSTKTGKAIPTERVADSFTCGPVAGIEN